MKQVVRWWCGGLVVCAMGLMATMPVAWGQAADMHGAMSSHDAAAALVQHLHARVSMQSLANTTARETMTFRIIAKTQGETVAKQLVASEIAKAAPAYQPQWDDIRVSIYAGHFSAEELQSLAHDGRRSPYVDKLRSLHKTMVVEMKTRATPVLKALLSEALVKAYTSSCCKGQAGAASD